MITYKHGDIFESNEKIIAHGCNCSGGFGSGIAKTISELYPVVKSEYILKHSVEGWQLGETSIVKCSETPERYIVNCATQQTYGAPDKGPYVSYVAIRKVIRSLVKQFPEGFAIPKIGAGLAGGNWDIIAKIIEEESGNTEVRVYAL